MKFFLLISDLKIIKVGLCAQNIISFMKMTAPNPISNPIFNTWKLFMSHLSHIRIFLLKLPQSVEKINFLKYPIGAKFIGIFKISIQFSKIYCWVFLRLYIEIK